jgi:hypothetical protein
MTKTILFGILNFAHWNLFVIWCLSFGALFSGLSFSVDNKFGGRQFLQPHRAKGMKLGGADPNLCAQTQFEPIIEPCRGIDQNTG